MRYRGKLLSLMGFAVWLAVLWWARHWATDPLARFAASHQQVPEAAFSVETLRHPREGCFLGIYMPGVPDDPKLLDEVEQRVRRGFVMISLYQAWGPRPEHAFDPRLLNRILERGAIPVLTWEPWVTEFDRPGLPAALDRQFHNLRAIARGDYDFYVEPWARAARRWGRPLMIRLGQEMNAPWYPWGEHAYGNTAQDFVSMWQHVVDVFRQARADNVIWVWSIAQHPVGALYPGDAYVDWVGITVLNFGTAPPGWKWRPFAEMFAPAYARLSHFGKPIMIAEVASAEQGGDKAEWIAEAMGSLRGQFPVVRSFMWFNNPQDRYWPINWSLTSSRASARAFRRAAADPYFLAPPR